MKKIISALSLIAFAFSLSGANLNDIVAYKSGDSMAWHHELIRDAYTQDKRQAAEKLLLDAIKNKNIGDEAFRLSCKILKYAASEKSMGEILKTATSPRRNASVFDVLISAEYASVDKLLIDALKNKDADLVLHAAYALGMRKSEAAIVPLFELAKTAKPEVANAAIIALGHIPQVNSSKALAELNKRQKGDAFLRNTALAEVRESLIEAGKTKEASDIVLPDSFVPAMYSAGLLKTPAERMKMLDREIAAEKAGARYAARLANDGRTFENSRELISAYSKLSEGAKLAAIRTFSMTNDKRFFDVIKGDVKETDSPVNVEAILACSNIAPDSFIPSLEKMATSSDSSKKGVMTAKSAAIYALTNMLSPEADKALKKSYASSKSTVLLEILLNRGNADMKAELLKRVFDPKDQDERDISRIFELNCGFSSLGKVFDMMQKADEKTRDRVFKMSIKFATRDIEKRLQADIYETYYANAKLTEAEKTLAKSRFLSTQKAGVNAD